MNTTMFELAMKIGQMCTFVSLALHLTAGLVPLNISLREELRICTKEAANSSVLFLIFSWIFGVQSSSYRKCTEWLLKFSHYYMIIFLILVVGGALLHKTQSSDARQVGRQLKRSALIYSILFFVLAVLLG